MRTPLRSHLPPTEKEHAMSIGRRFKHTETLEKRLAGEAAKLREEAKGAPPGIERERLIRRA
jgi:hypothetical protein